VIRRALRVLYDVTVLPWIIFGALVADNFRRGA